MADVLWPYLRWPLHSRTRLLGCLLALALVFVGAAQAGSSPNHRPDMTTPVKSEVRRVVYPTTAVVATPPVPSPIPSTPSTSTAEPDPADVALRFVRAWAQPGQTPGQWRQDMVALAQPGFLRLLARSSPADVPASEVVGPAVRVSNGPGVREYVVLTDVGTVRVTLLHEDRRWKVSAIAAPEPWIPIPAPVPTRVVAPSPSATGAVSPAVTASSSASSTPRQQSGSAEQQ